MEISPVFHLAGWAAYINAVFNVISFASLIIFFSAGGPFGLINDITSVFFSLTLIPLAIVLHLLNRALAPSPSLIITIIGVAAMLTAAAFQTLLVFRVMSFEQTLRPVLLANAVIGIWLIAAALLARAGGTLPPWFVWVAIAAGTGLVLTILGFWMGGQQHPLTSIGRLLAFAGLLIFAIGFGRLLLAGRIPILV